MKSKGQMQILFGIAVILVIIGIVFGFNALKDGKEEGSDLLSEETIESPDDQSAPIRSNLYPTGTLPGGTIETYISVSINEPGYCRYSTASGKSYSSIRDRFSYDKDKLVHTTKIKGLKTGQTYEYFVRCRDLAGNKNASDAIIRFSVGEVTSYIPSGSSSGLDEIPPILSNLYPTGTLPGGTIETYISVSINEPGYCRYSTASGKSYSSMRDRFSYDQSKIVHTVKVKGLADNKIHEYFVRCRDLKGNENTSDAIIRFGVGGVSMPSGSVSPGQDITPPYRFSGSPDDDLPYTARKAIISLKTDEKAVCRHNTVSGVSYDAMIRVFSSTDSTFHSTEVTGFSEGGQYKYYIKCVDESGNKNTNDFTIEFDVESPEDFTPPVRKNPYPTGDALSAGITQHLISVCTNEPAYCRYSVEQGESYNSMRKSFARDEAKIYHTTTVKGLENGHSYEYFVRCKDLEGNANTGDVMIHFRVKE